VDQGKREGLTRRQQAVLLARNDMEQAAAAARALEQEEDMNLARALETAIAVCYMRPFTKGGGKVPDRFIPRDQPQADYHRQLRDLRHKVHAHPDKTGPRTVTMNLEDQSGEEWAYAYTEELAIGSYVAVFDNMSRRLARLAVDGRASSLR
jgi:hypothetical protein